MPRFLLFVLLIFNFSLSFGQLDNRVFEDRMKIDTVDSRKLFLGVNMLGFVKDNEYDNYRNPVITGYTLFGYQLNPYLSYHINKHIRIDGGIFLQKDFGNSSYTLIAPTLSIKYHRKDFSVIFGNLEGSLNHRLIEPLYDFERVLNNRLENGMQFQIMRDNLFMDAWIDWRKMIYLNDPNQEQLTAGLNLNKRIANLGSTQIWAPIQMVTHHNGGQINYRFSGPVETLFNSALGIEVKHQSANWLRETRLNGYYVYYKSVSRDQTQPFQDGSGAYINATLSTKYGLDVMGSYWYGHEFITVEGGKIYPSVSVFNENKQHHMMKLFVLRLLYNHQITDGLTVSARVEPYYDFYYRSVQTAYGVYLNFRERFFLWKPNK